MERLRNRHDCLHALLSCCRCAADCYALDSDLFFATRTATAHTRLVRGLQIEEKRQEFDTFKRVKTKEVVSLKKDSRRAETERRRLQMLNEKQRNVLQRKIQEADEARRRLAAVNARRKLGPRSGGATAPAAAAAAATARDAAPSPSPRKTATARATAPAAPAAPAAAPAQPAAAPQPAAPLKPNVAAPELPTEEAMAEWVKDEVEAASTVHLQRTVLTAELARRADLSKKGLELEQRVADIDAALPALSGAERVRFAL